MNETDTYELGNDTADLKPLAALCTVCSQPNLNQLARQIQKYYKYMCQTSVCSAMHVRDPFESPGRVGSTRTRPVFPVTIFL